jgi:CubicO group peptidase (beta-lactamase class C family)
MVRTQPGENQRPGYVGQFFWEGIWGTAFSVDPKEKLVAVLMLQAPALPATHYKTLIRNLVYQALVD